MDLESADGLQKPQNNANPASSRVCVSTGGRIRTLNLLIRSQVLYPVELRPRGVSSTMAW